MKLSALVVLVFGLLLPLLSLTLMRFIPPVITPLMIIRLFQGESLNKDWTPIERISPHLSRSVLAAEDNRFCSHRGIDFKELKNAIKNRLSGSKLRGASTISMQTAKNLYLWPGRSFVRKLLEAYLTLLLEALWPKRRILEVYLNIAEWGPGLYGAQAASQRYFKKPASKLTPAEAARLAVVLPSPRKYSPVRMTDYLKGRAAVVVQRADETRALLKCF